MHITHAIFPFILAISMSLSSNEMSVIPPKDAEALESEVHRLVWSGFETHDEVFEHIKSTWGTDEAINDDWLRSRIDLEFSSKKNAERDWPATTDTDRLDLAFHELNESGIIALQNTGYTQQDGFDDISQEYHYLNDKSGAKGWCFYAGQDGETALKLNELYLAFGGFDESQETALRSAKVIVSILMKHGLQVEWNGMPGSRLIVKPIDWQKRAKT